MSNNDGDAPRSLGEKRTFRECLVNKKQKPSQLLWPSLTKGRKGIFFKEDFFSRRKINFWLNITHQATAFSAQ